MYKNTLVITFFISVIGFTNGVLADGAYATNNDRESRRDSYTQSNNRTRGDSYANAEERRSEGAYTQSDGESGYPEDEDQGDYNTGQMQNEVSGGCPISEEEEIVCKQIMCQPMGMNEEESKEDCIEHQEKFDRYIASLQPWEDPAVCYERNEQCDEIGIITNSMHNPTFCDMAGEGLAGEVCESNF